MEEEEEAEHDHDGETVDRNSAVYCIPTFVFENLALI